MGGLIRGFWWVKWFDETWMEKPEVLLAYGDPGTGFSFWGDEPDADLEKIDRCLIHCFEIFLPRPPEMILEGSNFVFGKGV